MAELIVIIGASAVIAAILTVLLVGVAKLARKLDEMLNGND